MALDAFSDLKWADNACRSQKALEKHSVKHCDDMCGRPDVCDSGIGFPEHERVEQADRALEEDLLGL